MKNMFSSASRMREAMRASNSGVCILDGGLGSELERNGVSTEGSLWSTRALVEQPKKVLQAHEDFLRAGAQVILTASYQLTRSGLAEVNVTSLDKQNFVMRDVVRIACEARDSCAGESGFVPLVALSIGPHAAITGNEYDGASSHSLEFIENFQVERLQSLLVWEAKSPPSTSPSISPMPTTPQPESEYNIAPVDLVAMETLPSLLEVRGALGAVRRVLSKHNNSQHVLQAWVVMACRDGEHLNSGEKFRDAVVECIDAWKNSGLVCGIGINCTNPAYIESLLNILTEELSPLTASSGSDVPVKVVYPNLGREWDPKVREWKEIDLPTSEAQFLEYAKSWIDQGVQVIGGCCQTRPTLIHSLASIHHCTNIVPYPE